MKSERWIYRKLIELAPLKEDAIHELKRIEKLLRMDSQLSFYSFDTLLYPLITSEGSPIQSILINHLNNFKGNLLNESYRIATERTDLKYMYNDNADASLEYYLEAITRVRVGLNVDKINACQLAFILLFNSLDVANGPIDKYKLTDDELAKIISWEYHSSTDFWEKNGICENTIFKISKALLSYNIENNILEEYKSNRNYQLIIRNEDNYLKVEVIENWDQQIISENSASSFKFNGQLLLPNHTLFLKEEIDEFEYYLNKKNLKEIELQSFFKKTPKFLNVLGGYERVERELILTPQILLSDKDRYELRPDFFLKRIGINYLDILEIKLPSEPLVVGPIRHRKFSSNVEKGLAQLKSYRDFFDDKTNLKWFRAKYGYNITFPQLYLLIGRDDSFKSEEEKIKFSRSEYLQILTYDDLNKIAKHKMISA
jgi:hypothetical protein